MASRKPSVLFEDNHLLIIDKPTGLLSIPDRFDPSLRNLYHYLQNLTGEIYIVHRLDKETSGVICFAKNPEAHKSLNQQFENREVKKTYLAIVEGVPTPDVGAIDKPLLFSQRQRKMIISDKGKASLTKYRVLEKYRDYSLLEVDIKTGRTHQIRAHLQYIGHPLAIDAIYGNVSEFFLSRLKQGKYILSKGSIEKALISRCSLHALGLTIKHPNTQKFIETSSPLPKDLRALLNQLRKWNSI